MFALLRAFLNDDKPLEPARVRALHREGGVLLDVRTPAEYTFGHLDGALNLDAHAPDFGTRVEALDREQTYVVYCSSGRRARRVIERMQKRGFRHVHHAGSLDALACAGFPLALAA